jgi:hypothetical protein
MELTENGNFRLFSANGKQTWQTEMANFHLFAAMLQTETDNRHLFFLVGKR